MSKSDTFENDFLKLIFNAVGIAGLADNAAAGPLGSLYVSLHTADPGEGGNQTTSEIAYTGYARVAVARTAAGWVVTANSVSPAAPVTFGPMTAGAGGSAAFWAVGTTAAGAGKVLYSGAINPAINVVNNVTPSLSTGTNITED